MAQNLPAYQTEKATSCSRVSMNAAPSSIGRGLRLYFILASSFEDHRVDKITGSVWCTDASFPPRSHSRGRGDHSYFCFSLTTTLSCDTLGALLELVQQHIEPSVRIRGCIRSEEQSDSLDESFYALVASCPTSHIRQAAGS